MDKEDTDNSGDVIVFYDAIAGNNITISNAALKLVDWQEVKGV